MSTTRGPHSGDPVEAALHRAAEVLPDQGPIGVFVHHNTLHAFQRESFHDGVQRGASLLSARPYLELDAYRKAFASGRIEAQDLEAELRCELGDRAESPVLLSMSRLEVWTALMLAEVDATDAVGLDFAIAAGTNGPSRDRALWNAAVRRCERGPMRTLPLPKAPPRHRDALLLLGAADPDEVVHGELVRLCSAYLDQGQAQAVLPSRDRGFFVAVGELHRSGAPVAFACRPADRDLADFVARGCSAREVVDVCLLALGVEASMVEDFVIATLLSLRGFAGMVSRFARHPEDDRAHLHASLLDFLAVRLCYERRIVERLCAEHGLPVALEALRHRAHDHALATAPRDARLDALPLFAVAHRAGVGPDRVADLPEAELAALWQEAQAASTVTRQRVFHEAYERRYRRQILDALAQLRPHAVRGPSRSSAQFVFCIDEREESIRRALEEQSPELETFGAAGFFGVAMDYQGLYDREPAPHAPVVVIPAHEVHESPVFTERDWDALRRRMRSAVHAVERTTGKGSRGLLGGAGSSLLLGPLAGAAAAVRVLAPRWSMMLRDSIERWLAPVPTTRLVSLRGNAIALDGPRQKPIGFSLDEAADRVANTLKNLGLVRDFAPVVVVLGHGSTSLNNPHESAHDCGACGGRRGGANARLFAELANRLAVRHAVAERGVQIPDDCWFVGALHDTADDSVRYYDLQALPSHAAAAFDVAAAALEDARARSAHERCRRFEHAAATLTPAQALRHVEERARHLAQPRPEYGHCTNAIAVVGRRRLTRGLFLDRRAFLVSYDPTVDQDDVVLARILAAVGPVGAGISLEYYFSSVDNEVFGCGTKLPHNVTGLLGVINGHQGDLRTGLPLQMVEIHEPMRLLMIVEATCDALLRVAARNPEVMELVGNRWVQLVSVHPETGAMHYFDKATSQHPAGFVPYVPSDAPLPTVQTSAAWYEGRSEHLAPVIVASALRTASPGGAA